MWGHLSDDSVWTVSNQKSRWWWSYGCHMFLQKYPLHFSSSSREITFISSNMYIQRHKENAVWFHWSLGIGSHSSPQQANPQDLIIFTSIKPNIKP